MITWRWHRRGGNEFRLKPGEHEFPEFKHSREGGNVKRPIDDDWGREDPERDQWLYSGYWNICVLLQNGSGGFWEEYLVVKHISGLPVLGL